MSDIPFLILSMLFAVSGAIIALGYVYRTSFPMSFTWFISGSIFLIVFISTDSIQLGYSEPEFLQTPLYSVSHPMNVTTSDSSVAFSATIFGLAERPANINSQLVNKKINCIEINMLRTGSPTDNVMIGILDNDNRMIKLFGNITASTINTGTRSYQVCLSNHDYWILAYNDYIGAKHLGSVGANNIAISTNNGNPFDSTNSVRTSYTTSWSDVTTSDLRMKLTTENLTIENTPISDTSEPINYPIRDSVTFEPTLVGMFFIVLSLSFIMIGVLIEKT